jgi:hypothetical protein
MTASRQSANRDSRLPLAQPDQEQAPQRFSPSRRALLTAGGVTAGGAALGMAGGMGRQPSADAATDYVAQGAQVISVNDAAYNATGNGWTDDTNAIQAALNATPAGGKCLIPAPPTFAFTATHASPCVFTAAGTAYTAGMIVTLSGTSLPGGFTAGTQYYIVDPSGDTFELSGTSGGTAINSSSTGSGGVSAYYLISATLQIPSGVSVQGPGVSRPGKYRDAAIPTPPVIRVAAGKNLTAIISDTAYPGSGTTPSSAIQVSGLVIDGTGMGTGAAGHGIALMSAASSVENCGVQNVPGAGIVFADESSGGGNNTTVAQDENGVYKCNVYNSGSYGIWVQNNNNKLTDGYVYDSIVDFDFLSSNTVAAIQMDNMSGWRVTYNHVYAQEGPAYVLSACSGSWICNNYADNFGQASVSGTTYYGFNIQLMPYGDSNITGNHAFCKEAAGAGAGTFIYYNMEGQGTANTCWFADNSCYQRSATSATSTGYSFSSASGDSLTVRGVTAPLAATGTTISAIPSITGTVTFPDFRGSPQTATPANPAGTKSTTLVMAGLAIAFAPAATGKITVNAIGGAGVQTGLQPVKVGLRYGTGAAPANGAAVTGTTIGVDQIVFPPVLTATWNTQFALLGEATGLTVGTKYWIDLAFDTGSTADEAQIGAISILIEECS